MILIGILSLVALSFISLALIKRAAQSDAPPPTVQTSISGSLDGDEADGQRFPAPPQPITASNKVEGTISAPPAGDAGDGVRPNWPATPAGGAAPAPGASAQGWPPPKPGVTAPETAGSTSQAGGPPVSPTAPAGVPGTAPASLNQNWPPQTAATSGSAPLPPPQSQPGIQPGTAATTVPPTPAEAPRESWPPKPPPPKSPLEQMASDGSGLPKPRWQTLDQEWAKANTGGAAAENLDSSGAAWKQIDVGQTDDVKTEPTAAAPPEQPKKPVKVETKTATPTRVVPGVTKPGTRTASTKYRKSRSKKSVSRQTPRLAIINESGYPDQARVYRDVLAAMGYRISSFQDRPSQPGPTRIYYRSGYKSKAANLARRIPGKKTLVPMKADSRHDIIIRVRD